MSPRLALHFLGSPQIDLDKELITLERRKALALLAYLAVERGVHSRESLSALLWPDYNQSSAFKNLRQVLWEIQKTIGESWLVTEHGSVGLIDTVGAKAGSQQIWLDVHEFNSLFAEGCAQADISRRLSLLADSAKLYRNHFLTGFSLKDAHPFNDWAFGESEALRQKLSTVLRKLAEDQCAIGQAPQAIPHARRLVSLDPLNEVAHRQLMEVYLQAGQQNMALKHYQDLEQLLREELNLDPQPETRELYKKIRKGEMKPVPQKEVPDINTTQAVATTGLPTGTVDASPNNLPVHLSKFIGREAVQAEITALLRENRLVTLVGVGGIGKTRLSLEAARESLSAFPNGVWFVELASLSEPELVPQTVFTTLGLIEQAGRPLLEILTDFLRSKRALLILDNCEHLIQACAQLAQDLLYSCPDLHILATSREALGIPGEIPYPVPALTIPDPLHTTLETLPQYEAAQLFIERARSASAGFRPTEENLSAIAQLCYHLDGIPLAIELAAARVKLLRVEEIAARLDDRFRLLRGGARTALPRHQTLQALIDWSYDLLSEAERVLLRRLSVFAGEWTLEAAEYVTSETVSETVPEAPTEILSPFDVLDPLTSLVNKSLITVKSEPGQETRYAMLETIRQYASEKLWQAGEGELLRRQHLAYYVDLAERAEPNLRAPDIVMWLDRLEAEHENIRSALEWALEGEIEAELRLASALLWFWHIRGHKNEGIEWLERALSIEAIDIDHGGEPRTPHRASIRGKALNASGSLMVMNHEFGRASGRLEESLALFKELGPAGKQGMAHALLRLASLSSARDRARGMLQQSLAWFREIGDKFGVAETLMQLSGVVQTDDPEQAVLITKEQLALSREIGDQDGIAAALAGLADMALSQDDYQQAIRLYEESLAKFRTVKNLGALSMTFGSFGDIFFWQGDYPRATKTYEEALAFVQELGYRFHIAFYYYSLGILAWFQGEYSRAMHQVINGQSIFRDIGHHWLAVSSLHTLGDIALAKGDEEEAAGWYQDAMNFGQEVQLEIPQIFALQGLGMVAWAKGDYDLAAGRYKEGLKMSREGDSRQAAFHSLCGLGRVAQSRGDYVKARALYLEALELQKRRVSPLFNWTGQKTYITTVSYPLAGLAILAAAQNQMGRAARLIGAAESLYTPLRFEMSAVGRIKHDQTVEAIRAALGDETFTATYQEGGKMTLEEAVAFARSED
jgi:predicted ATPase/DNA-binding SARP family transcriptional activator/predicted negative regulator of RcsB-dependent stress response